MESAPAFTESPRVQSAKFGSLKHLQRLLGVREVGALSTDAVFMSLDLEVASERQRLHLSTEKPVLG
ncbi:hypothetical protein PT974_10740 [Cladobotryum mycophilum]|uniref:Uncharacterized protein n=1 Tax=Cladobotryum mycophilum TaxID=491253 RepID=A0ABR0SAP3_9HYPO